jgi:hypothetical protein
MMKHAPFTAFMLCPCCVWTALDCVQQERVCLLIDRLSDDLVP